MNPIRSLPPPPFNPNFVRGESSFVGLHYMLRFVSESESVEVSPGAVKYNSWREKAGREAPLRWAGEPATVEELSRAAAAHLWEVCPSEELLEYGF